MDDNSPPSAYQVRILIFAAFFVGGVAVGLFLAATGPGVVNRIAGGAIALGCYVVHLVLRKLYRI